MRRRFCRWKKSITSLKKAKNASIKCYTKSYKPSNSEKRKRKNCLSKWMTRTGSSKNSKTCSNSRTQGQIPTETIVQIPLACALQVKTVRKCLRLNSHTSPTFQKSSRETIC